MPVGSYSRGAILTAEKNETLREVAERMEKEGVGLLAVIEDGRPAGVLTDRDIALHHGDGDRVGDAMNTAPTTIRSDASLGDALQLMGRKRVRRLLVTDTEKRAFGVLSVDDLLRLLASEISGLASVSAAQLPEAARRATTVASSIDSPEIRPVSHYAKEVVSLRADSPVQRATHEMRRNAIGCVVVTQDDSAPVGVITDRDVALRVVARGQNPETTILSAVMSAPPITAESTQPVEELIATMRERGIRRMPVVREGRLVGLVSFDDLLVTLGDEFGQLCGAVAGELRRAALSARAEDVRTRAAETLREAASQLGELGGDAARKIKEEIDALRERLRRSDDRSDD